TGGNAGVPLGKSHLELSHRERLGDRHLVHGFLIVVLLRAHHELTRWYNHHLRARVAVLAAVLGLQAPLLTADLRHGPIAPCGRTTWWRCHCRFRLGRWLQSLWRDGAC